MTASTRANLGGMACVLATLGWLFGMAVNGGVLAADHWNYHGAMALTAALWIAGLVGFAAAHGQTSGALRLAMVGLGLFLAGQAAEFVIRQHGLPIPILYPLGLVLYGVGMGLFGVAGLRQKRPPFTAALPLAMGLLGMAISPAMVVMGSLPAVGLAVLLAHGFGWLLLGYALWRTGTRPVADAAARAA